MMKRVALFLLMACLALPVLAQEGGEQAPPPPNSQAGPGRGGMRFERGRGVAGTITEVKPDGFVLKSLDGKTVTVKTTDQTRFRNGRDPAKPSDFKVGDAVAVMGAPDGDSAWTANLVVNRTAMEAQMRAALGKEFIAGEVKAIDGTKLTILRPDNETQTIEVDENTSFRKQRESITLADIKVGDHVMGRGQLKDGVFVPSVLNVGMPGMGMGMGMGGGRRGSGPGGPGGPGPGSGGDQPAPPPQ